MLETVVAMWQFSSAVNDIRHGYYPYFIEV